MLAQKISIKMRVTGKEFEKEYIYYFIYTSVLYIKLNQFAIQQKLTQYFKSTILDFKFKFFFLIKKKMRVTRLFLIKMMCFTVSS